MISSPPGDRGLPNGDLVKFTTDVVRTAVDLDLEELAQRLNPTSAAWVRTWPGEHYRLLAALAATLQPAVSIEIGTFLGEGALSMAHGVPGRVVTYDLVPWREFPDTNLREDDFVEHGGRLEQRIGDLADPAYYASQREILRQADLIFFDGPKDGEWESRVIPELLDDLSDRRRTVVFDDIRFVEMVEFWRSLPYAKVDLSGFGHWSGTGVLWTR